MSAVKEALRQDAEARVAAQTVFDRPLILEAGAGTGKTTTLVSRLLAWMLGAGWEEQPESDDAGEPLADERRAARVLDGVVAITFTEAAAAEMAQRLGERLAQLAKTGRIAGHGFDPSLLGPRPVSRQQLVTRARALLGGLERVTLSTIHAFCSSLLRRHALALGLHPDFRIDATEELSEEVAREVVERATREAYARGDSPLLDLAARGIDAQSLVDAAAKFTREGVPPNTLAEPSFSPPRIAALRDGLARQIERLRSAGGDRFAAVRGSDYARRVDRALSSLAEALAASELTPDLEPATAMRRLDRLLSHCSETWDGKLTERLNKWCRGSFIKAEESAFGEAKGAIAEASGDVARSMSHLAGLDPAQLELARRALHPLLVEIESLLISRGIATFQSLLVDTHRLLADPQVRRREGQRIRQLLVDEFQDTDEIQCDIVARLALSGPREERPGLFVVGDPKQSIYAWRNADLGAYEAFLDRALEAGGARYRLARNFRSAPEVLDEVERAISPVMVKERGRQPAFEPLLPGGDEQQPAGFAKGQSAAIEYWCSWDRDRLTSTNERTVVEIEARAIAADIARLHHEYGEPWNEFAVLLRAATRLDEFLEAFRAAAVPFAVTGDRKYYRRREVIDAAALVRAVVHPLDHVALLAFLRSTAVGVPDAAWIPLWRRGFPAMVSELGGRNGDERLRQLDEAITAAATETPDLPDLGLVQTGWPVALRAAVHELAALRTAFRQLPVDRFIEELRSRILLEASEGARYLGVYRVANLERFFRRLEAGLAGGHGEVDALLRALRRSVAEAREDEEALPKHAAEDAVQVLTIHKAKGLEFGHVYLPQLGARTSQGESDKNDADRRPVTGEQREFVLFRMPSIGWEDVAAERTASAVAEQTRILYVAMTRAQKRLVLIGKWANSTKPPSGRSVPASIRLLRHRAPFPNAMKQLAGAIEDPEIGLEDEYGARWKIPDANRERDSPPEETTRKYGPVPKVEQVERWARELAADGEVAAQRTMRPLFATASRHDEKLADLEVRKGKGFGLDRPAAQAMGRWVHRALETWDLTGEPATEWARQREHILSTIAAGDSRSDDEMAKRQARWCEELFERLRHGELLTQLYARRDQIIARELPLAVAAGSDDEAVIGITGTVDLLLRDDTGALTVVDFKTDEIETEPEITQRREIYAPQISVYARAVQQALDLSQPPAAELWFLWPGVAVSLEPRETT